MRRLRILFLASGFFKVGDYYHYKALGEALARNGHSVTILTGDMHFRVFPSVETVKRVKWIYPPYFGGVPTCERLTDYLPETKLPYDILYRVYFTLTRAGSYDVIHGFHVGFNTYLPLVAALRRGPAPVRVFDWCDLWDKGILRPPRRGLLKKIDYRCSVALERLSTCHVDGVTVNNTYLGKKAVEFGVSPQRIQLVRSGAYTEEIRPVERRLARQRLQLDPALFLLGFSGFFHPDTELLLEAFALVRSMCSIDVRLLFIGSTHAGLTELIRCRGLDDAIIYVGRVEHERMGEYLSACDLLLLPYTDRPVNLGRWPFKLGDYLSAGRPVVAGGYGDVKQFFAEHPEIGMTCEGTPEAFAHAVMSMINDPDRRSLAEHAARRVAVGALNWEESARVAEEFYLKLLAEKKEQAARRTAFGSSDSFQADRPEPAHMRHQRRSR